MQLFNTQVEIAEPLDPFAGQVRYTHLRNPMFDWDAGKYVYHNNGGFTMAYRYLSDAELEQLVGTDEVPGILVGFSGCSIEDNFDRGIGRGLAQLRLMMSRDIILGSEAIHNLLMATYPHEAYDLIRGPLANQGIRYSACA